MAVRATPEERTRMTRVTPLPPEAQSAEQRALYDVIVGGPRASQTTVIPLVDGDGRLLGPFEAMLLSPRIGHAAQALGAALRYGSGLTPRVRELAVLAVARRWDSEYERYAHEAIGLVSGLTPEEIAALRDGRALDLADPLERAAADVVRDLLERGDLDDEAYEAARGVLGEAGLFELSTLVGYYGTLALQLRLFRVRPPDA
jgi:4-carboxymuconolactone decarboxylase